MTSTIYKQISCTFLLIMLVSFPSIAQNIEEGSRSEIITSHPVGEIHKSYFVNNEVVLLANTRSTKNLSVLLLIMDEQGNLKSEKTIGKEVNSYEHPVALCKNENEFYLLANRIRNGNKSLVFYHLDAQYESISEKEIFIPGLEEGTAMIQKSKHRLWITATVQDDEMNYYPKLIEFDIESKQIINEINLNKKNEMPSKELERVVQIDAKTSKRLGSVLVTPNQFKSKICNNMICSTASCEELVLVGYETTDNNTDFWVAKMKQGVVSWEKLYKTQLGGDEAFDVFIQDNNYLVLGLEYTKIVAKNYELKRMLLDENGKVLSQQNFKDDTRTFYKRTKKVGNNYVLLGQSENAEYDTVHFSRKINSSDISLTVLSQNLEKSKTHTFRTEEREAVETMVVLPDNRLYVFYKIGDSLMKLEVKITD
ncbi:MAG: hypothetical protein AB8B69_21150 [Chitinophagales bacterium]